MRPRWRIGLALAAVTMLALAVWTIREMSAFSATERTIAAYCRTLVPGVAVAEARTQALAAQLLARDMAATRWHPAMLAVESSHDWFKGSVCVLRHNGEHVTQVSYDPWYQ